MKRKPPPLEKRPLSTKPFRPPMKACQHLAKPLRQRLKRQRRALKRHQLAINDHRQTLNPCKQAINALASSPDAFAISITNRAILIITSANPLNNRAAISDDQASTLDEWPIWLNASKITFFHQNA
jgi:hypothetical protein